MILEKCSKRKKCVSDRDGNGGESILKRKTRRRCVCFLTRKKNIKRQKSDRVRVREREK